MIAVVLGLLAGFIAVSLGASTWAIVLCVAIALLGTVVTNTVLNIFY